MICGADNLFIWHILKIKIIDVIDEYLSEVRNNLLVSFLLK